MLSSSYLGICQSTFNETSILVSLPFKLPFTHRKIRIKPETHPKNCARRIKEIKMTRFALLCFTKNTKEYFSVEWCIKRGWKTWANRYMRKGISQLIVHVPCNCTFPKSKKGKKNCSKKCIIQGYGRPHCKIGGKSGGWRCRWSMQSITSLPVVTA